MTRLQGGSRRNFLIKRVDKQETEAETAEDTDPYLESLAEEGPVLLGQIDVERVLRLIPDPGRAS